MDYTIENKILERMKKAKRGLVFFTSDFTAYGNSKANNKALERLTKQGKIMRVGRGIYTIPRKSKFFGQVQRFSEKNNCNTNQPVERKGLIRVLPFRFRDGE